MTVVSFKIKLFETSDLYYVQEYQWVSGYKYWKPEHSEPYHWNYEKVKITST